LNCGTPYQLTIAGATLLSHQLKRDTSGPNAIVVTALPIERAREMLTRYGRNA